MEKKNYIRERDSINEIAKEVISEIQENQKDPFVTPVLVFHNMKVAQWFKAYYLKNNNRVLMNAEFVTLPVFINSVLKYDPAVTVMDCTYLRDAIIRELLGSMYAYDSSDPEKSINYIFYADGTVNGTNLFEFASKLSELFMAYEMDREEISGWEKELFDRVKKNEAANNWYTTGELFKVGKSLVLPEGPVYVIDNSYMTALYEEILEKIREEKEDLYVYCMKESDPGKVSLDEIISAPSKLREVEALHSEICKNIKEDTNLRFNDMVVYVLGIKDYASSIRRVFHQDNVRFPSIPFRISGDIKECHDMVNSLSILFDIANKGCFTRSDFYQFACNPLIQRINGFSAEDAEIWKDAILKTNTHRNGINDDWGYIKKRMLISLLVAEDSSCDNVTELSGGESLPYSAMDLDQDCMNKMVLLIEALENWCDLFSKEVKDRCFTKDQINKLRDRLAALYSRINKNGEETSFLFRQISKELDRFDTDRMPVETMLMVLMDTPNSYSFEPADLFTGGVTFMELAADNVIDAKYSYVLGLSSDCFPRKDIKSELDESKKHKPSGELDKLSLENIRKNSEKVRYSYVNCDLKTEEEFFPSFLLGVTDPEEIKKVSLDETRPYSQLFSDHEFRNKDYAEHTGQETAERGAAKPVDTFEQPFEETISTSDIKSYLKNSVVYKYNKIMKISEDDTERIGQEYEVLSLGPLESYGVVKEMIKAAKEPNADDLQLQNKLPIEAFGESTYGNLKNCSDPVRDELKNRNYQLLSLDALSMKAVLGGKEISWTLKLANDIYRSEDETASVLSYLEPVDYFSSENEKPDKVLGLYAASLMDVAGRKDEKEYQIYLGLGPSQKSYGITPSKAKEILNRLYLEMNDYDHIRYMDIDFVSYILKAKNEKTREKRFPKSIYELYGTAKDHKSWKYFDDNRMIDPYTGFGYEDETIREEFEKEFKKTVGMILYYKLPGKESEGDSNE